MTISGRSSAKQTGPIFIQFFLEKRGFFDHRRFLNLHWDLVHAVAQETRGRASDDSLVTVCHGMSYRLESHLVQ